MLASIFVGRGRPTLLASLASSTSGLTRNAAPLLVESLMGLPLEFMESQAVAEQVYKFHKASL